MTRIVGRTPTAFLMGHALLILACRNRKVMAHMLCICVWNTYRDKTTLEREFHRLPYQPYEPVYAQLCIILRRVNRARRRRGFEAIDQACIRKKRRLGTVFVEREESEAAA